MKTSFQHVIIGGGIAGTTAAEIIRRHNANTSLAIVSAENAPLYSRIMLSKPNFFLEKIPFHSVWLRKPEWYHTERIALQEGKKAMKLDTRKKEIQLDDGNILCYEKLLLAIGGCCRPWGVPGADMTGVFRYQTIDDAKAVIAATKHARSAVIVGGGFISFEMAEMLTLARVKVTIIIREKWMWQNFLDEQSGKMIERALKQKGIRVIHSSEVKEIRGNSSVQGALLLNNRDIPCDMIIVGIGTITPLDWIQKAGIAVKTGILANEFLETNAPNVWTAGDCAEFYDLVLGERVQLGNWVNAAMQGRVAGMNMIGQKKPFRFVSVYSTKGFGITICFIGDARPLPDRMIITRNFNTTSQCRLIIKNGEILGATLINKMEEIGIITKLIEQDINVSGKTANLSDPSFSLSSLIRS